MHETHPPHAGPSPALYLVVFAALAVFTAASFAVRYVMGAGNFTGVVVIMAVAVCKAALVTLVFMHLKWDWRLVGFLIVPAVLLAAVLVAVLVPDHVTVWW